MKKRWKTGIEERETMPEIVSSSARKVMTERVRQLKYILGQHGNRRAATPRAISRQALGREGILERLYRD